MPTGDAPLCLSWWQPWGTFCADGTKQYETRGRPITYRGTVIIHAAKTRESLGTLMNTIRSYARTYSTPPKLSLAGVVYRWALKHGCRQLEDLPGMFPLGAAIGICEFTGCFPTESVDISMKERMLGDYSPGRWAIRIENPRLFKTPLPMRGQQGFWRWPKELPVPE